jgi:hypothetical protein
MLELLDQIVRNHPGGEMKSFLSNSELSNMAFIKSRIGLEADRILRRNLVPRRIRVIIKLKAINLF